jgi:hypothetical protein
LRGKWLPNGGEGECLLTVPKTGTGFYGLCPVCRWIFWQYSGSGLSHGVKGRIHLNTLYGSADD